MQANCPRHDARKPIKQTSQYFMLLFNGSFKIFFFFFFFQVSLKHFFFFLGVAGAAKGASSAVGGSKPINGDGYHQTHQIIQTKKNKTKKNCTYRCCSRKKRAPTDKIGDTKRQAKKKSQRHSHACRRRRWQRRRRRRRQRWRQRRKMRTRTQAHPCYDQLERPAAVLGGRRPVLRYKTTIVFLPHGTARSYRRVFVGHGCWMPVHFLSSVRFWTRSRQREPLQGGTSEKKKECDTRPHRSMRRNPFQKSTSVLGTNQL